MSTWVNIQSKSIYPRLTQTESFKQFLGNLSCFWGEILHPRRSFWPQFKFRLREIEFEFDSAIFPMTQQKLKVSQPVNWKVELGHAENNFLITPTLTNLHKKHIWWIRHIYIRFQCKSFMCKRYDQTKKTQ